MQKEIDALHGGLGLTVVVVLALLAAYIVASTVGVGVAFLLLEVLGVYTGVGVFVGVGAALWALIATYRHVANKLAE